MKKMMKTMRLKMSRCFDGATAQVWFTVGTKRTTIPVILTFLINHYNAGKLVDRVVCLE